MHLFRNISFLFAFSVATCSYCFSQASAFSKPSHFNDLHTVYTYQKSNWDGSHASTIFLYVKDSVHLESFKWTEGDEWATLVSAEINWDTYAVRNFYNHRILKSGDRKLIAELKSTGKKLWFAVNGTPDSSMLDDAHWQSYDFDFAGLGFTWRALKDKTDPFSFLIADAAFTNNKLSFEGKGRVQVEYIGKETINSKECLKYKIDGAGLQNKGGHIWIDPSTYMIELYRIELPDEEGFVNGQLKLLKTEKLSPGEWEQFIADKMSK